MIVSSSSIGRLRDAIFPFDFDDLELRAMDVEGMIHVGRVLDSQSSICPALIWTSTRVLSKVFPLIMRPSSCRRAAHRLAEDETASHCRLGELRDPP